MSTAFHDLKQLQHDWGQLDYAFLSPIFDSISKEGYTASFDMPELQSSVASCTFPLYALGGRIQQHVGHLLVAAVCQVAHGQRLYEDRLTLLLQGSQLLSLPWSRTWVLLELQC